MSVAIAFESCKLKALKADADPALRGPWEDADEKALEEVRDSTG